MTPKKYLDKFQDLSYIDKWKVTLYIQKFWLEFYIALIEMEKHDKDKRIA